MERTGHDHHDAGAIEASPELSADEAIGLHGEPAEPRDVEQLLTWHPDAAIAKRALAICDEKERERVRNAHNRAYAVAEFLVARVRGGRDVCFTWQEFWKWRQESKGRAAGPLGLDGLPATDDGTYEKSRDSWAKNFPGAFTTCYQYFPCRRVEGGGSVGLAVVATERPAHTANTYCLVYRHPGMPPKYAGGGQGRRGAPDVLPIIVPPREIETLQGKPSASGPNPPRPAYHCVPPSGVIGREHNHDWLLSAIVFLDGMTSTVHEDHLVHLPPDVHSPDVIRAAREKLETEPDGFCFLIDEAHTPVGYASLWRLAIESENDLYTWIKGHGTMPRSRAILEGLTEWDGITPPGIWLGYISGLRIHPRCRGSAADPDGLKARDTLVRGVVAMLERYARHGHLFVELIVWTSHVHEREFLGVLRGEHPPEVGENTNIMRVQLWPPLKGGKFKRLAALYEPHKAELRAAAEEIRGKRDEISHFSRSDD